MFVRCRTWHIFAVYSAEQHNEWISKTSLVHVSFVRRFEKYLPCSTSVLLECMRWDKKLRKLLSSVCFLSWVRICANKIVGLKFSVISLEDHTDVGVCSNWSRQTCTCMCDTKSLSYTHTLAYTLWKTSWQKKFLRKWKVVNLNFVFELSVSCKT